MRMPGKIILFCLLAIFSACSKEKDVFLFTSFHEPANEGLRLLYSYDGLSWKDMGKTFLSPQVGGKVMRDPSIARGKDGIFHLVWTSAWRGDKGFGYASSKDLIHWSEQKFIPVMEVEPATVNVWAPELYYDNDNDVFTIIWASTIPFRFAKGVEEEENNHRMYYTTTKDFENFSRATLFFDPGFSVIDCVIVPRGKDDYVLLLKDNTRPNRNIKVAFGKTPDGKFENISDPVTPSFTEGPAWLKKGDDWIIYYDAYRDKKYGAVKTKDFKTFENISEEIRVPEGHKHGTIIKVPEHIVKDLLRKGS